MDRYWAPALNTIRAYLKEHDLQGKVAEAVTKCVQTLPADPNAFLAEFFAGKAGKAPAAPAASPVAEEAAMIFAKADADHDGKLTKNEAKKFLNATPALKAVFVGSSGWQGLWAEVDTDGDSEISLDEWKAFYCSKMGGGAPAGGEKKLSKKEKKAAAKAASGGGGDKKDKKKGGGDPEAEAAEAKKKHEKHIKAVVKEGGKKGVEVEGAADMGGMAFFCTMLKEPEGNLEELEMGFEAMNAIPDPNPDEERRGGAGGVGKMVFSAGAQYLSLVCNVPDELQKDKEMQDAPTRQGMHAGEWVQFVLDKFAKEAPGLKVMDGATAGFAKAQIPANKDIGFFPLKIDADALSYAYEMLRAKHCVSLKDSSSEGPCFGDFEDDY